MFFLKRSYTCDEKKGAVIMWFIIVLLIIIVAILFFLPSLSDRKKSDNQERAMADVREKMKQNDQGPHL